MEDKERVKIVSVQIKLGENVIELDIEDAKELQRQLNHVLGNSYKQQVTTRTLKFNPSTLMYDAEVTSDR